MPKNHCFTLIFELVTVIGCLIIKGLGIMGIIGIMG